MIAPAGGLGQSGPQTAAERYTYQAGWVLALAVGLAVAAAIALAGALVGRRALCVPTVAILAPLAFLSIRQQGFWRDTEALWLRQLEVYPLSPTGNHHLGSGTSCAPKPGQGRAAICGPRSRSRRSITARGATLAGLLARRRAPTRPSRRSSRACALTGQEPKELAPRSSSRRASLGGRPARQRRSSCFARLLAADAQEPGVLPPAREGAGRGGPPRRRSRPSSAGSRRPRSADCSATSPGCSRRTPTPRSATAAARSSLPQKAIAAGPPDFRSRARARGGACRGR